MDPWLTSTCICTQATGDVSSIPPATSTCSEPLLPGLYDVSRPILVPVIAPSAVSRLIAWTSWAGSRLSLLCSPKRRRLSAEPFPCLDDVSHWVAPVRRERRSCCICVVDNWFDFGPPGAPFSAESSSGPLYELD